MSKYVNPIGDFKNSFSYLRVQKKILYVYSTIKYETNIVFLYVVFIKGIYFNQKRNILKEFFKFWKENFLKV